jgi:hypothetical protein
VSKTTPVIERDCQEAILDILPEDGGTALAVMAQLSANMIISILDASDEKLELFIKALRAEHSAYAKLEEKE